MLTVISHARPTRLCRGLFGAFAGAENRPCVRQLASGAGGPADGWLLTCLGGG